MKVGSRVLERGCFSLQVSANVHMAGIYGQVTHSNSTRYGPAAKEAFSPTLTEGLACTARPANRHAVIVNTVDIRHGRFEDRILARLCR
jgi:hypothetical protein